MKSISHEEQRRIWEEEHSNPYVLKQMDSSEASSGVARFWDFLKDKNNAAGIEIGCGKGRNVIWLAEQGADMHGLDFSSAAIAAAKKRAAEAGAGKSAAFLVQDVTEPWQLADNSFDFGIDCFATTDIESVEGRLFAMQEMRRVLKPGGYLLAYLLSTDDEFHKEMIRKSPAGERNAFLHPTTGKFEKTYDEKDIEDTFKGFDVVRKSRVAKTTEFFGKTYACLHHWIIFQKPA
jgi:ubiquinone/menaquinone biosynthesis C-methylase UbiE